MFEKRTSFIWRRHPDLNRGMRVLQTLALPLGYVAMLYILCSLPCSIAYPFKKSHMEYEISMQRTVCGRADRIVALRRIIKETFPSLVRKRRRPMSGLPSYIKSISAFKQMERATRLELATSTLARWRSTG